MAENLPTKTFDDAISRYERRIAGIKTMRELLEDDPEFAAELLNLARSSNGASPTSSSLQMKSGAMYERVLAYFTHNLNEWTPVSEIAKATEIKPGTVSYVLYHDSNSEIFEKRDKKGDGRIKEWRMNPKGGERHG